MAAVVGFLVCAAVLAGTIVVAVGNNTMPMPLRASFPVGLAMMLVTAVTGNVLFIFIGAPLFIIGGCADILYSNLFGGRPRHGSRGQRK